MDNKEVRMRCIEAASCGGIRAASAMIEDAKKLEAWVRAAEPEKEETPPKRGRKASASADKEQSPA